MTPSFHHLLSLFVLFLSPTTLVLVHAASRPHIVLIVADDLGWMDVGWRDADMATPTLDRLVSEGVNLTNSYVQALCSPSRAALLSGKYPFKLGMQNSVLAAMNNASLPLGLELLPERLQSLGYATHLVGKWHLGFCSWAMTPTYRGFDSFYGMYLGQGDYYTHRSYKDGFDLHFNQSVLWDEEGAYSTHLFTNRAMELLETHDPAKEPLFLMLSFQAVHGPLQVPQYYVDQYCSHISNNNRRLHCALTAAMDEGIANVTDALSRLGYDDNLLLFFTTDNGGPPSLGSSNWPLRGGKSTLWEGGTRATAFLHSKTLLPAAPYSWDGMVHIVDWFPTLLSVAGDDTGVSGVDGMDLWSVIQNNQDSLRNEIVYNINEVKNRSAIRQGRYKLAFNKLGNPDGWFNPPQGQTEPPEPTGRSPTYRLFDVVDDPEEMHDIIDRDDQTRQTAENLKVRLEELALDLVPSNPGNIIASSKPTKRFKAWYPGWC